jgi:pimeloyl-ACP methyl ester carboxylesterase
LLKKLKTIDLFYRRSGAGKPLVILHGLFGLSDNWAGLSKFFAEQFDTILVDLRNHGQSPHNSVFNYEVMAADVAALIQKLELPKVFLIGHSMGGKVAMVLALQSPELIDKLFIADIGPKYYPPHHQSILKALFSVDLKQAKSRKQAEEMMAPFITNSGVMQFLLKNLCWPQPDQMAWRFNLNAIADQIEEVGKPLDENALIELTTLFIRGENSDYILDEDWAAIQTQFLNSELQTIEKAGHWLHAEQPQAFYQVVTHFLNS